MYFQHSPTIWQDFPQLAAGTLALTGVTEDLDTEEHIETFFVRARERLQASEIAEMPEIAAWRSAYGQMGLKPTQYRCAAESLLRRFKKEDDLPRFHPLVNLCNALSLAYAIPIAVYDTDHIIGGIEVRYSEGIETHLAFSGENETPEVGEVVFADDEGHAHSRRWCFRQSKQSVVTPSTSSVLIVSEAMHSSALSDVASLIETLTSTLTALSVNVADQAFLSQNSPRFEY